MTYLVAAVVVLAVLCLFNLVLSFGIIRRLRQHTELLNRPGAGPAVSDHVLPVGATVPEFSVVTIDGTEVGSATVNQAGLVGFFSSTCPACKERLPDFLSAVPRFADQGWRVLAAVVGSGADRDTLIASLRDRVDVVAEELDGELTKAFSVTGYPAFVLVENGQVSASGFDFRELPEPVARPAAAAAEPAS